MSGKTNELIKFSKDITEDFDKREYDVLLSSGEQKHAHYLLALY